jgi:hypothetical protein
MEMVVYIQKKFWRSTLRLGNYEFPTPVLL